jgi:AcrR family transcriptional regulator
LVSRRQDDNEADQGFPGFTMEAVARRAGAIKATGYRHWGSQSPLLVDAMDAGFQPFSLPSTGALRTDLIELLSLFEGLVSHGPFARLMAAFIDAAECDPTLWSLHAQLTERRREPMRHVLAAVRTDPSAPTQEYVDDSPSRG